MTYVFAALWYSLIITSISIFHVVLEPKTKCRYKSPFSTHTFIIFLKLKSTKIANILYSTLWQIIKSLFHKQNFSNIQRENCIHAFNDRNKSRVGNEKVASKNMHNMKIFCFFLCVITVLHIFMTWSIIKLMNILKIADFKLRRQKLFCLY